MDGLATQCGMVSSGGFNSDAQNYFDQLSAAGSSISANNQIAVNDLVIGLKSASLWDSIEGLGLLAGPDDVTGALIPLKGPATTPVNVSAAVFNRTTGILGGSSRYLNTGYNTSLAPFTATNIHLAAYTTTGGLGCPIGDSLQRNGVYFRTDGTFTYAQSNLSVNLGVYYNQGAMFAGVSRNSNSGHTWRIKGSTGFVNRFAFLQSRILYVLSDSAQQYPFNGRVAVYSFGTNLDLSLLEPLYETYVNNII